MEKKMLNENPMKKLNQKKKTITQTGVLSPEMASLDVETDL